MTFTCASGLEDLNKPMPVYQEIARRQRLQVAGCNGTQSTIQTVVKQISKL